MVYEIQMRRLEPGDPPETAAQSSDVAEKALDQREVSEETQANLATSSKEPPGGTDPFQNIPLPSSADEEEQHILDPKTLLECCRCSRSFNQEDGLPVGTGNVGVDHSKLFEYGSMIQEELKELNEAAKAKRDYCKRALGPFIVTE